MKNSRVPWIVLAAGLAAWTAAGYATLERFPPWSSDEAFNLNGAWTSVKTGRLVAGFESDFFLDAVKAPRIGDGGSRPEPFQVRAHPPLRWSVRLFGPTVRAARLPSLAGGLALLCLVAALGWRLGGPWAGVAACGLAAIQPLVWLTSHSARTEIALAVLVSAALLLIYRGDRPGLWPSASAGLLIGLGPFLHPNGALLSIPFGLALWMRLKTGRPEGRPLRTTKPRSAPGSSYAVRTTTVAAFAVGLAVGWAGYAAAYILPDPAAFRDEYRLLYAGRYTPPYAGGVAPLRWLSDELARFSLRTSGNFPEVDTRLVKHLELGFVAWWLGILLRRERPLLAFVGGTLAIFTVLVRSKAEIYLVTLLAAFLAPAGAALADGLRREARAAARAGALALLLFAAHGAIAGWFYARAYAREAPDYKALSARLAANIADGKLVMGHEVFWPGLSRFDFRSQWGARDTVWRGWKKPAEALDAVRPDVVLSGADFRWTFLEKNTTSLASVVRRPCRLLASVDTGPLYAGRVDAWEILWNRAPAR